MRLPVISRILPARAHAATSIAGPSAPFWRGKSLLFAGFSEVVIPTRATAPAVTRRRNLLLNFSLASSLGLGPKCRRLVTLFSIPVLPEEG